jgi:hypothetical protein
LFRGKAKIHPGIRLKNPSSMDFQLFLPFDNWVCRKFPLPTRGEGQGEGEKKSRVKRGRTTFPDKKYPGKNLGDEFRGRWF